MAAVAVALQPLLGATRRNAAVPRTCQCGQCGRRQLLASLAAITASPNSLEAAGAAFLSDYEKFVEATHPSRPDWYKELYARTMNTGMKTYEAEIAGLKKRLFARADKSFRVALELGVGTGPNFKYYAAGFGFGDVIGVDPNEKMEKYASEAALSAGFRPSRFKFIHGVGEKLPLPASSVDAVVSTLVLCSVSDLPSTLREVRRVLKPGGLFMFIEHVAAQEGTALRFWQGLLDPLQQLAADGCHLTRNTLAYIQAAGFADVDFEALNINNAVLISPHIIGVARA